MRLTASHPILPANREEKVAKLKDFVLQDLEIRKAGALASPCVYTVIARSPDSPVMCALDSLSAELAALGVAVQALFFDADLPVDESTQTVGAAIPANIDARYLHDARFASAHEQLVLGPGRVWIGDCMRRDPAKRDAFEMYHDGNADAAGYALASFLRLWSKAGSCKRGHGAGLAHLVMAGQTATVSLVKVVR